MKLCDIATALGGRLFGNGDLDVLRPVHPAEARLPTDLALAMDKKLVPLLADSAARTAVIADGAEVPDGALDAYIMINRPRFAMAGITELFARPVHRESGIHPTAVIAASARLGAAVSIGPFVVIGPGAIIGDRTVILSHCSIGADAQLGADCLLHPGVRIGDRVIAGDRVIIHHNASIGADGFSFVTPEPGSVEGAKATGQVNATNTVLCRIHSLGSVILGDDVEIGANAAVDRGTISDTRIGRNTKIDNMVQIGHNVTVGENCMLCGQSGTAGSVVLGDRVVLAGQVGVGDHVKIGHDSVIGAKSGVGTDVPPKSVLFGTPAMPRKRAFDQILHLSRLKALFADVISLRERLKTVEQSLKKD
ncbi:MAG: UDP-3-O-(3-hydroxymyristoyl)glucosamine N-acyltransferase [Rhodospirillaceae bacterium]